MVKAGHGTAQRDTALGGATGQAPDRQQNQIELIATESIASREVLPARGSVLANKYAEG